MTAGKIRILFTSAGRRVELTQCFRNAAMSLGVEAEIHACDLQPTLSAACQFAESAFAVPKCDDPNYAHVLVNYCEKSGIDLVIPMIDTELAPLSAARDRFAAVGAQIHVAGPELIAIVRDKALTIDALGKAGLPVPRTAPLDIVRNMPADWQWPLFAKPSGGSASRGIQVLSGPGDIRPYYDEPMLAQELLHGDEYTVNIYSDADGSLVAAVPHLRLSVRAGEVEKGRTVRNPRFREIAERVVRALPNPRGVMCFQLIDDVRRGPCVFEVNARFGGGYPLADHAGARFAESLIAERLGRPACASDDWREGVEMIRYDAAFYRG
ncbi:MAG: ATP-grasp domain-containing protein [Novosphingobium sp.]